MHPLRHWNTSVLLTELRLGGPMNTTELVDRTGLSRPTVHAACAELIRLGWATELEPVRPKGVIGPGRSARQFDFRPDAGYVLGADMGANKVIVVLADLRGDPVEEAVLAYGHELVGAEQRLETVREAVASTLSAAGVNPAWVLCATVGVPGPVDIERGATMAREAFLPGLADVDLRAAIGMHTGWDVQVENDCNLAALGETWRGVAAGVDNVLVMLAGERLGAGIIADGRLTRGNRGGAGELSYLFMVEGVGNTDGIAMVTRKLGRQAAEDGWHPPGPEPVQAEIVLDAARRGDPVAGEIVTAIGDRFARVVATLSTLFDPELLVIAGGVADSGDVFLPAIRTELPAALERLAAHLSARPPRLEASTLGDHVVVTGAVRLALDRVDQLALGSSGAPFRPAPRKMEAA